MDLAKSADVPPHLAAKYAAEAGHYWDLFYRRNQTRFFKDRHWFSREFPLLLTAGTVLEVGCGVGNTAFPLLEINPGARVYACDFAPSAIELLRAHPAYASGRVTAFVADITADDLTAHVPPACVDVCTMIFVLSAIPPNGPSQRAALRRVAATLRPGARLLFRDYAEGDLAQERLRGEGRQARTAPNTFVRWDGTLCEYFTEAGLRTLFASEGFRCDSIAAQQRTVANVRQGSSWERRFVQATFTFVGGQQPDGGSAGGSEQGGGATAPQVQQQQQQLAEPAAEVAAEQLLLRLPGSPTELRLACRPAAAGAAARAAAEALAALVLACPAFFSAAAVLELCGWDAPLGALAALRWCRRAVAAGASEAQVHLLRLNVRRNGHLFIYERLRLQHLAWAQPQGQAEQAQAEQARREQQAALLRAVPGGFDAVLATVPCTAAGSLQELLAGAAQLLARRPCSLLLLCAADPAAVEQVGEAAAAAGLRAAQLPPELETAAAALQGVRILALQHA